ncbi:MAG TPA: hypothetical protein VMU76_13475 [Acidimicrobiales bacterium]|nr:hypothetical protein [Acidimicrobiales bacterium]
MPAKQGWPDQPVLTAEDDNWHEHSPHWFETETTWWSFNVPERRMGGWLYTQALAVQGTCNGGAWVWDGSDAGALYEVRHEGLPFPDRGDLRKCEFPNGNTVEMLEPLMKYRTTYSDPGGFEADLVHEGIMPPHSHAIGAWPFWATRHFDQPMHVTGTIVLRGEEIPIDCYSVRDRSWGPRPTGPVPEDKKLPPGTLSRPGRPRRASAPHSVGYAFGTQDPKEAFMAFTDPWIDHDGRPSDDLDTGYLLRDGEYAPLVEGHRTTELAEGTRFIRSIHLEATDALGRELTADGTLAGRHGTQGPSGTGLFHWAWTGGCTGWGEDQTYGPTEWLEALDSATGHS